MILTQIAKVNYNLIKARFAVTIHDRGRTCSPDSVGLVHGASLIQLKAPGYINLDVLPVRLLLVKKMSRARRRGAERL